jgi:hypothetical protein
MSLPVKFRWMVFKPGVCFGDFRDIVSELSHDIGTFFIGIILKVISAFASVDVGSRSTMNHSEHAGGRDSPPAFVKRMLFVRVQVPLLI